MKIKLTKGELKRQRDALKHYERYLPTLQLKKQQLQLEILRQNLILDEKKKNFDIKKHAVLSWSGLLIEDKKFLKELIGFKGSIKVTRNIAGVDLPVFERSEFVMSDYDLFSTPLWVDRAIESIQQLIGLKEEIMVFEESISILRQKLRIATQRVNLFEKIKIPEAEKAILLIKIYIGDQMANAVGRSKIAKRKIEEFEEASA
ncbi:MAG: V-type ATP synthase subunit D [Patescibacteria group bacterium]